MSIGGYLLFFHTFGSAEFTPVRKCKAKNTFFSFAFRSLIHTFGSAEFTPVRKCKAKNTFFPLHFAHLFVTLQRLNNLDMKYVDVILPLPLDGVFTYAISDELAARAEAGMRVVVPFNKSKRYTGVVVSVHDRKPEFEVKAVMELLDERPILLPEQLR